MGILQDVRCKVGLHRWGALQGDNWGAYHQCEYCGKKKRLGSSDHRPDMHDPQD